jgi:hypothetical protein
MAVGTWKIYAAAKKAIGAGTLTLGAGVFKMQLHRASASANIMVLSTRALASSVPAEISATGGYAAHGRNLLPAAGKWTVGASAKQMKFSYSTVGLVFTANSGALTNIKYALIRNSVSATGGKLLCYCTLSSSQFTIASGNSLTITPAGTGIFTLA